MVVWGLGGVGVLAGWGGGGFEGVVGGWGVGVGALALSYGRGE